MPQMRFLPSSDGIAFADKAIATEQRSHIELENNTSGVLFSKKVVIKISGLDNGL